MEHNMILSASGWRKVFTQSGDPESKEKEIGPENEKLCILIGETFAQYMISHTNRKNPVITVGRDTRPTGKKIQDCIIKVFLYYGIKIRCADICSAPEIMAYAKTSDGFLYISASHNPIGHNGIKFGFNDGGVVNAGVAKELAESFCTKCGAVNAQEHALQIIQKDQDKKIKKVEKDFSKFKKQSLKAYSDFLKTVITGEESQKKQDKIFLIMKSSLRQNPITILSDMNGSSRTLCIDRYFLEDHGLKYISFNEKPGQIVHAIIPEPENLVWCAQSMMQLQQSGKRDVILGYMPDCDGDRGNLVYWDEKSQTAKCIKAQEVFALSVLSELSFESWKNKGNNFSAKNKMAVCVNCPTSMRIDDIAKTFGAETFRAEVGEANVVNLAREKRKQGYKVRILGEGSNGGNITYPSSVRDPLSTVFAMLKLLTVRDVINKDGSIKKGLFHLWCEKSGQEQKYISDFTLQDIIDTLPQYTTTGVSEKRALLKINTLDKGKLKLRFQKIFEQEYKQLKDILKEKYKIDSYTAVCTNGTAETENVKDFNNGNGGLKIKFLDKDGNFRAYIWMRPSGTEPVFRILCDVKGDKPKTEKSLLEWETSMLMKADKIGSGR